MNDEHVWFRSHLADYLLDLLDEAGTARLLTHRGACPDCAALLATARAERSAGWLVADHPSPAMLVRWQRDPAQFSADEARTMREHLEACGSCRADLGELTGERAIQAVPDAPATTARAPVRRPTPHWALGAIGGAMATAATFLIVTTLSTPVPPSIAPVSGLQPATTNSTPPATPLLMVPRPVQIQSVRRGAASATGVVLDSSAPIVSLQIPVLFVADTTVLTIELLHGEGTPVARIDVTHETARRSGLVLDGRTLNAGRYTLKVTWTEEGRSQVRDYPVHLERR